MLQQLNNSSSSPDNIFAGLLLKRNPDFLAGYADFKKAFDSVDGGLFWELLYRRGNFLKPMQKVLLRVREAYLAYSPSSSSEAGHWLDNGRDSVDNWLWLRKL